MNTASERTSPDSPASSAARHHRPRAAACQAGTANARNKHSVYPTIRKTAAGAVSRYSTARRPPASRDSETTAKQPATPETASSDSTQLRRIRCTAASVIG